MTRLTDVVKDSVDRSNAIFDAVCSLFGISMETPEDTNYGSILVHMEGETPEAFSARIKAFTGTIPSKFGVVFAVVGHGNHHLNLNIGGPGQSNYVDLLALINHLPQVKIILSIICKKDGGEPIEISPAELTKSEFLQLSSFDSPVYYDQEWGLPLSFFEAVDMYASSLPWSASFIKGPC